MSNIAMVQKCMDRIHEIVTESEFPGGVVIGLSGGVDSTLCAKLCVDALGVDKVFGVIMPAKDSNPDDEVVAKEVAEWLGIKYEYANLEHLLNLMSAWDLIKGVDWKIAKEYVLTLNPTDAHNPASAAWVRLCMMKLRGRAYILARIAAGLKAADVQTLNLTEILMGWYDRAGDGVGDIALLSDLYKTDIYNLAAFLELPMTVILRASGSGNYPETITDEEHAGMSYEKLDANLKLLRKGMDPADVAEHTDTSFVDVVRLRDTMAAAYRQWIAPTGEIFWPQSMRGLEKRTDYKLGI